MSATRRTYSTSEAPASSDSHDDSKLFTAFNGTNFLPHSFRAQLGPTARRRRAYGSGSTQLTLLFGPEARDRRGVRVRAKSADSGDCYEGIIIAEAPGYIARNDYPGPSRSINLRALTGRAGGEARCARPRVG